MLPETVVCRLWVSIVEVLTTVADTLIPLRKADDGISLPSSA